jgi:hypothetical protein
MTVRYRSNNGEPRVTKYNAVASAASSAGSPDDLNDTEA